MKLINFPYDINLSIKQMERRGQVLYAFLLIQTISPQSIPSEERFSKRKSEHQKGDISSLFF